MEEKSFKLEIGGRELIFEIKNFAEQANGSILARYGDTVILSTAVMSKQERREADFFPLTVEYEERYYAAGKILGSRFIRRESRPSDEAILTARAIDRAIRPRFPKNLFREVQVVTTCLSWDGENDPDIIGLLAASIALSISDIPWLGPLSAIRIGKLDGSFVLNPTYEERTNSGLDLVLTGTEKDDGFLINMIEMESKEVNEKTVLEAYQFAKPYLEKIIDFQKEIIKKVAKEKIELKKSIKDQELEKEIRDFLGDKLEKSLYQKNRIDRSEKINILEEELTFFIEEKYPGEGKIRYAKDFLKNEIERVVHENIIKKEKRPDGRKLDEIRDIQIEVGLLPRTHGSGFFARGETKALSILTLGAPGDVKLLEGMEIRGEKRFMHHYNFPPYSAGEIKPMRGPGRREIGHGMLVEKSLLSLIPTIEEFPYTMRIVTEILSSNGSTSMASVSAASLALMDAGVPIKRPAAGIAVGLMTDEKGGYKLLADIQGPEDHYGDMDFKIAGTKEGMTAIQMDVKINGITEKILKETLELSKKLRLQILDKIAKVLSSPRPELSPWAPRIYTLQIKPEKIREVIGPGVKVIHYIIEKC